MPPLQRHGSSVSNDSFTAIHRAIKASRTGSTTSSSSSNNNNNNSYAWQQSKKLPPLSPFDQEECLVVVAQRDVIIGTNPIFSSINNDDNASLAAADDDNSTVPSKKYTRSQALDILDMFTSMCVCETTGNCGPVRFRPRKSSNSRKHAVVSRNKARIVYPIAKYPARLNSPLLVNQRRKSVEQFMMFRPVNEE